jgi:hypothetical protein
MSTRDEAVKLASFGILRERHHEQTGMANRDKVYAIYVNATPTPEDAHEAVKIVEAALKAHVTACAVFHANEAARFEAALVEVEAQL